MQLVGVLVLVMVAILGCRPPAVPALPSKGGPPWVEVQTEHFTIWTDSTRGEELAAQLERFREGLYGSSLFAEEASSGRILVFAFRNAEEVGAYLPEQFSAYAWAGGELWQPTLTLDADSLDSQKEIIGHELGHAISFEIIRDQPQWFAEGLAGYYETMRFDGDKVEIGRPIEHRVRTLRDERPMPSRDLFACNQPACMDGRFYATAWGMFAWLATEQPDKLVAYMKRLVITPEEQQDAVFAEVFPEYASSEALDHALAAWMAHGNIRVREVKVPPEKYAVTTRALGDVGALLTRGIARYVRGERSTVPQEIQDALVIEPTNIIGRLVETMQTRKIAPDVAQKVVDANKLDWRAWYLLAHAVPNGRESFEAYRTMCDLMAGGGPIPLRAYCAKLPPRRE